MKKVDFLIIIIILLIALLFRLYKINTPLADLYSWRQADTAAVARNYTKSDIDLLHPRYDDISSVSTGKENPQGLRFVEFPLYNAIFAFIYKLYPIIPLEIYGRLTSIFFSLIIILIIYYLALKESGRITAMTAALIYAIFPFFVFFSRVVLPETTSLSFVLLAIFFLYLFAYNKSLITRILWFVLSIISFASAVLIKPPAVFYAVTLLFIFWRTYKFSVLKQPSVYLYFVIATFPFVLWRFYISYFPEGIPPNEWLLTSVNTYEGLKNIFFRPAFFRWIFFERINNYILGGYLTFFLILGLLAKQKKFLLLSFAVSAITYLLIFQGGNIQHEYYQTYILPAVALLIGKGVSVIFEYKKLFFSPIITMSVISVLFIISYFFSFYKVRDYYSYPPELPQIAKIIMTLTKEDDKIITDRLGDTTLLYLAERRGAPAVYKDLSELKKLGYKYLVTLNQQYINQLKQKGELEIIFENNQFALFKL